MHIGVLEDDADQLALIQLWLNVAQHTSSGFSTVAGMVDGLKTQHFDVLLLDWMLPDGSGADVLQWVRQNMGWKVAVVVVTARDDEAIVVQALQAGADDFVVKPPKQHELMARLIATARRTGPGGLPVLRLGDYETDIPRHILSMDGHPVTLTQKEFDLAVTLFQSPAKLLSRDHLLSKVWGVHAEVDTRTVDTHVSRLRKKLILDGTRGWKMVPVYGYGYRLDRVDTPP
jgi:two-component system, OmpR family, response regulator RegX3